MKIIPYIVICFLSTGAVSNEFDSYVMEYNQHIDKVKSLTRRVDLYQLESDVQKLKTTLQKDKLECQKFGGCQVKNVYTPLSQSNSDKPKTDKQKRDDELSEFANRQLPIIASINNGLVKFEGSPQLYQVGNVVAGVWVIQKIDITTVQLRSKDDGSLSTIYFYWK